MSVASLSWSGGKSMRDKLRKLELEFGNAIPMAMRAEAELIMTDSKANYVPRRQGTLRASGRVGKVERVGKILTINMSYGGAASAYALAIHEHLSAHSPPTWRNGVRINWTVDGTGPKYLEKPIRAAAPNFASNVSRRLR